MIVPVDVLGIVFALIGVAAVWAAAILDNNTTPRFLAVASLFTLGIVLLNAAGVLFDAAGR